MLNAEISAFRLFCVLTVLKHADAEQDVRSRYGQSLGTQQFAVAAQLQVECAAHRDRTLIHQPKWLGICAASAAAWDDFVKRVMQRSFKLLPELL